MPRSSPGTTYFEGSLRTRPSKKLKRRVWYRLCACVGVVRIFPHTHRHFVGQKSSSNVRIDPLLAPYQLDSLVAHVCYKANRDVCHTAAILDAAHGNVQQPAHNLVAV